MTLNNLDWNSEPKHPLFGTIETLPDWGIDHKAADATNKGHINMVRDAITDALTRQAAREARQGN